MPGSERAQKLLLFLSFSFTLFSLTSGALLLHDVLQESKKNKRLASAAARAARQTSERNLRLAQARSSAEGGDDDCGGVGGASEGSSSALNRRSSALVDLGRLDVQQTENGMIVPKDAGTRGPAANSTAADAATLPGPPQDAAPAPSGARALFSALGRGSASSSSVKDLQAEGFAMHPAPLPAPSEVAASVLKSSLGRSSKWFSLLGEESSNVNKTLDDSVKAESASSNDGSPRDDTVIRASAPRAGTHSSNSSASSRGSDLPTSPSWGSMRPLTHQINVNPASSLSLSELTPLPPAAASFSPPPPPAAAVVATPSLPPRDRRFLTHPPDYALKPLPFDDRGWREVAFYERIADANASNKVPLGLSKVDESALQASMSPAVIHHFSPPALCSFDTCADLSAVCDALKDGTAVLPEAFSDFESRREVDILRRLAAFTPSYYGVLAHGNSSPTSSSLYLVLRDTTANFSKPTVIDLKMGPRSFEPGAPVDKLSGEARKYPEQTSFGFRITGMRIYDPHDKESTPTGGTSDGDHPTSIRGKARASVDNPGYLVYDKAFGRGLKSRADVRAAFVRFFTQAAERSDVEERGDDDAAMPVPAAVQLKEKHPGGVRTRVVTSFRREVKLLANWFKDNTYYHFYSSSLLFVYEGDESCGGKYDLVKLRMIDFAHVRRLEKNGTGKNETMTGGKVGSKDEGYLDGLFGVMSVINDILEERSGEGNK